MVAVSNEKPSKRWQKPVIALLALALTLAAAITITKARQKPAYQGEPVRYWLTDGSVRFRLDLAPGTRRYDG